MIQWPGVLRMCMEKIGTEESTESGPAECGCTRH
jgi:hypothetical protein